MIPSPAQRPAQTSAERPAPVKTPEVWLRDADGHTRRIKRGIAERLVCEGIAEQVSTAGHIRLNVGVRLQVDFGTHGLKAIETSRLIRGDAKTRRDIQHKDRSSLRWQPPEPK